MDVEIVRNPAASEYELLLDGERIGELEYIRTEDVLTVTHTTVAQEHSGQGLAARLVEAALKDIRAHGEAIVPKCPYVRGYIVKHPQWADLVPDDRRDEFGLATV